MPSKCQCCNELEPVLVNLDGLGALMTEQSTKDKVQDAIAHVKNVMANCHHDLAGGNISVVVQVEKREDGNVDFSTLAWSHAEAAAQKYADKLTQVADPRHTIIDVFSVEQEVR